MLLLVLHTGVCSPARRKHYARVSASAFVAGGLHSQKSGEGPRLCRSVTYDCCSWRLASHNASSSLCSLLLTLRTSSTIDVTMRRCHAVVAFLTASSK
jgi:hypothetical protein